MITGREMQIDPDIFHYWGYSTSYKFDDEFFGKKQMIPICFTIGISSTKISESDALRNLVSRKKESRINPGPPPN